MTDRSRRPASPTVAVVIPALNEAANLRRILPDLPPVDEVILVDGRSSDGTVEAAREAMPQIRVVTQTRRGKGNALACGFASATADIIVMFDADGSADPKEIARFVAALQSGADFAKGSREMTGGGSEDLTRIRGLGNRGSPSWPMCCFASASVIFVTATTPFGETSCRCSIFLTPPSATSTRRCSGVMVSKSRP